MSNIAEPEIKRTEWNPVAKELYNHLEILTLPVQELIREILGNKVESPCFSKSLEEEKEDIKSAFFHCQVTVPIAFRDEPNESWILVVQHTNKGFGINTDPIDLVGIVKSNVTLLYGGDLVPHGTCVLRVKDPKDIANKAIGAWMLKLFRQQKSTNINDNEDDKYRLRNFMVYGDIRDAKKYLKESLEEEDREYDYYNLCRRGRYEARSRMEGLQTILDQMNDIEL